MLGLRKELTLTNFEDSGNCGSLYRARTHPVKEMILVNFACCLEERSRSVVKKQAARVCR